MTQPVIPRWRGFNLTELTGGQRGKRFAERDFAWMAKWGMDFARLPMSYWAWSTTQDWMTIDEDAVKPVDEAIEFGRQHRIHINLNFHRSRPATASGSGITLGTSQPCPETPPGRAPCDALPSVRSRVPRRAQVSERGDGERACSRRRPDRRGPWRRWRARGRRPGSRHRPGCRLRQ